MPVINKANVPPPVLPKQVVDVPELGGEVIVRGLLLSDRVRIMNKARDGGVMVTDLLACTVVDADGQPVYSAKEWEEFGASNFNRSLELFKVSRSLSGLDAEVNEKKS